MPVGGPTGILVVGIVLSLAAAIGVGFTDAKPFSRYVFYIGVLISLILTLLAL